MLQRTRISNIILTAIGATIGYALTQVDDVFYQKMSLVISYKWICIIASILILTALYSLLTTNKINSSRNNENFESSENPDSQSINSTAKEFDEEEFEDDYLKMLGNLAGSEKVLLKKFLDNDTKSLELPMKDSVVSGLAAQGIMRNTSPVARTRFMYTNYSLEPIVFKLLKKYPELLK